MTSGREMTVKSSGTVLGSSVLMNNWLMKTVCQPFINELDADLITGIGSGLDVLYIDTMSLDELFTLGIKPVEGLFRAGLVIVPIYDIVGQGRIDNELIFRGPSRMGTRRNTQAPRSENVPSPLRMDASISSRTLRSRTTSLASASSFSLFMSLPLPMVNY